MVKQCGSEPPEIVILGDNVDEIYEKDLIAAGYKNQPGSGRLLQAEDLQVLMSEIASEINIDGYESKIEDLITFDKNGQIIANEDPNGNGRILSDKHRQLFFKKIVKAIAKPIGQAINNGLKTIKKAGPQIGAVVGGTVGFITGGPAGAIAGAKVGF